MTRVALVTGGAGRGIGHGITGALAAAGWSVAIVDRDADEAARLGAKLQSDGAHVEVIVADVASAGSADAAFSETLRRFGRVDALVNSVGVGLTRRAGEATDAEIQNLFEVNLLAAMRFTRACLPALIENKGGMVSIGSVHAVAAAEKYSFYAATKSALEAYTRGVAVDYGGEGVRANIVHPGLVESPQNDSLIPAITSDATSWFRDYVRTRQCLPRLATAREVGELVAFLLDARAGAITGQAFNIDGGTSTLLWNRESMA